MIYANVTLSIEDHFMKADKNIILYRGDKNVEIRFILKRNKFVIFENTYAQMIIKRPSARSIFSEPALVTDNMVIFTITEEMIDELKELGEYTFQIRLFDDNMVARATLPPCEGCLIIKKPIAVEGEALINVAMINDSAVMAVADVPVDEPAAADIPAVASDIPAVAAHIPALTEIPAYDPWAENTPAVAADIPEDQIFDENNSYNRTVWVDGDIITDVRMNKIENALYQIKETAGVSTITAPYISTFLPENIIVKTGEDFELELEFRSQNLGNGTLKVFINDVDSVTQRMDQGISTIPIAGELFNKGTNMVVVYVLDRTGLMTNSLTFYIRYGGLEITPTFDSHVAYDYGSSVRYYFVPTSLDTSLPLTFFIEIDGVLQDGLTCVSDVRSSYDFPATLSVGNHFCRAWITDGTNDSNIVTFNLVLIDNTSLVVASDTVDPSVEEGDQLSLDYKVYMKNQSTFITKTYVDNILVATGTCGLATAYYRTSSLTEGVHTVRVEVFDLTETKTDFVVWNVLITPSTYALLTPANAGSTFMGTAYSKTNNDERRDKFVGTDESGREVTGDLVNFAFNEESGWVNDELIINGYSWVDIPIQPLANNAPQGFTLDIEFSTRSIGAENAEVLSIWNDADDCGIKITTEQLIIKSKGGRLADLYFPEDEVVSAIFVIDRDEKTAKIYLNGVVCEAFALSDYEASGQKVLEDFTTNSNVYLGGYNKTGYCKIKNLRIYNLALSTNEILNNYMSNNKNKQAQKELVAFQRGDTLPTLTIYCDFSGLGKDDKKPCDIVYNSPDVNLYGESFRLDGKYSTLQYQETSSMQYPIKNYRINPADANGKVKLDPFNTGVPESRFTLKADFMSSGHWQNTGLAKWVNDNLYNYNTNDPTTMNARKWYDLQNGGSLDDTRESIAGFPCRLILINDGNTALQDGQQEPRPGNTKDMGIFNFNNDKDNVATMGFDTEIFPNALSYEVTANSDISAGAFVPYEVNEINIGYHFISNVGDRTTFIPVSYFGSTITNNSGFNLGNFNFFSDTAELSFQTLNNGNTISVPNGATKISFNRPNDTVILNDITINCTLGKIGETIRTFENYILQEPYYEIPGTELEYLQQSFELRFPDADDYGSDYGYLGIPSGDVVVDYGKVGAANEYITTKISIDYLGGRTLTVTYGEGSQIWTNLYDSNGTYLSRLLASGHPGGSTITIPPEAYYVAFTNMNDKYNENSVLTINGKAYKYGQNLGNTNDNANVAANNNFIKDPYYEHFEEYGLKRVIDWVGNATDEQFVEEFDQYFHRDYTLRYYLLVIILGMVDNLGKNMMFDTFDGRIWLPRFYDMDTICSYDNSGEIKFDVDIEMEQGYWNTSASRLWTKIRDLMHDELVLKYDDMRKNGMSYESFMSYFYGEQISKIPQTYYNKDFDVKYAPYADEYMGKAHGDGYEHLKRWLKRRLIFTDTLFDYGPSYETDTLTIRANTTELMSLEIETHTPVYQHVSFYNGNMEKVKVDGKTPSIFNGYAQTATDQEVIIYGGSNVKAIRGLSTMNPNSMLLGKGEKISELNLSNCPILTIINSNKANFAPHSYLNKLDISNCPQLTGILDLTNSSVIQEINAMGSGINSLALNPNVRSLRTLKLPRTVTNLTLRDAGELRTFEMEEGGSLQSLSLTNCSNLDGSNTFNFDEIPTVYLDNSYNANELYLSNTTNLTLKNLPNLERVIYTPNNEYETFDINNVINGPSYKITTSGNPKMTDFMITAPYRKSHNNDVADQDQDMVNLLTSPPIQSVYFWSTSEGRWKEGDPMYHYVVQTDPRITEYHIRTTRAIPNTQYVRCTSFDSNGNFLTNPVIQGNGTIMDTTVTIAGASTIYFVCNGAYLDSVMASNILNIHGALKPYKVFAANTLDLGDTQFQNVKILSTADIYNLKVPTTMKNFYCDSAYDIDTDYVPDADFKTIHEDLVEPYTTNYGDIVYKHVNKELTILLSELKTEWDNSTIPFSGFIEVAPMTLISTSRQEFPMLQQFDKDKNLILEDDWCNNITLDPECRYIKISMYGLDLSRYTITYTARNTYTPNIIPTSASGSLIFNMYSNNTTKPISTSPYMWDLTGLKLNDFYTYGMNNWVKGENVYTVETTTNGIKTFYTMDEATKVSFMLDTSSLHVSGYGDNDAAVMIGHVKDGKRYYMVINRSQIRYAQSSNWAVGTVADISQGIHNISYYMNSVYAYISVNGTVYSIPLRDFYAFDSTGNDGIRIDSPFSLIVTPEGSGDYNQVTMPHRMPGYSVRMVNADISPVEQPTMFYPLLIDTGLPITGKIDYLKYKGTSLAWAYAYTTDDVDINPVTSKDQERITCDYNKLYNTDFVDDVDVWIYEDTNINGLSDNPNITKAYIELTSANYQGRIADVMLKFTNVSDVYLFDDGTVTSLWTLMTGGTNNTVRQRLKSVTFMEGYFIKTTDTSYMLNSVSGLEVVNGFPPNATGMNTAFGDCGNLHTVPDVPNGVTNMNYAYKNCSKLANAPKIPDGVRTMSNTFLNCTSLTEAPVLPDSVTDMGSCFYGCTNLTEVPNIPNSCGQFGSAFRNCSKLVSVPEHGWKGDMYYTFGGCASLNCKITIASATGLGLRETFHTCRSLTIPPTLPSSIQGASANTMNATFVNCSALTQAPNIPIGIPELPNTFSGCTALIEPPELPDGVTNLGSCFRDCTSLTKIPNIPDSVYSIANAFLNCTSLRGPVVIPQTCTHVSSAFEGCTSLQEATVDLGANYNPTSCHNTFHNSGVTSLNWIGLLDHDLDIPTLVGNARIGQMSIQLLVPEMLANVQDNTLILGSTFLGYLTDAEKIGATNKGWTLE